MLTSQLTKKDRIIEKKWGKKLNRNREIVVMQMIGVVGA